MGSETSVRNHYKDRRGHDLLRGNRAALGGHGQRSLFTDCNPRDPRRPDAERCPHRRLWQVLRGTDPPLSRVTRMKNLSRRELLLGTAALSATTAVRGSAGGNMHRLACSSARSMRTPPRSRSQPDSISRARRPRWLPTRPRLRRRAGSGAARRARVIGTAHTLEKAREACARVQGHTSAAALELTEFDSVVACAGEVQRLGAPLDVSLQRRRDGAAPTLEQVRGIEKHFGHEESPGTLPADAARLLPQVTAAAQGRVVVVSSGSAYRSAPEAGTEFDDTLR